MNRTDRLHALTEELRRAGPRGRTAARLAAWLEVSTRTIKRDVAALQQTGLPVWAQPGPGGGYVLDGGASLRPVNLTPAQAVAVAVALAVHHDGPYAVDGRTALEKILDVMDPAARERAERLGGRVWMRTPSSGRSGVTAVIEQGLAERRVVALTYRDRRGTQSRRRAEPHLIAHASGRWYLVAWCQERRAPRWFRWDRIISATLTTAAVPDRDPAIFGTPPPGAHPIRRPEPYQPQGPGHHGQVTTRFSPSSRGGVSRDCGSPRCV